MTHRPAAQEPSPASPSSGAADPSRDGLTVGRTASLVGVTVKTLHHWDAIGLVRPSGRTWAGHRVYSGDDVARLHRALVYKEIGLPLADIVRVLDAPDVDARGHLRRQRTQLLDRIARLQDMVSAVDRMMAASKPGMRLTPQEQVDIFGADWQPAWVDEAEARWGDSAQWAQYERRAAAMTPEDWRRTTAETEAVHSDLATAKRTGVTPGSAAANALAERHRASISRYFDCTHTMHVCIARTYVTEPGYTEHFDAMEPGLTYWLRDVIFANAESLGIDPRTAKWE
ncbi:MerR family transcriptional regulator [Streptomyces sp. NPDC058657]|uniref:MerR family transcriptional regulator n=1 Tax=unclassified Streptomyces TaxID=2593676 RepID=UPI00365083FA